MHQLFEVNFRIRKTNHMTFTSLFWRFESFILLFVVDALQKYLIFRPEDLFFCCLLRNLFCQCFDELSFLATYLVNFGIFITSVHDISLESVTIEFVVVLLIFLNFCVIFNCLIWSVLCNMVIK